MVFEKTIQKISTFLRKKETYFYLAFSLIILYAFLVRFLGTKFGLPYLHHYDEPHVVHSALRMLKSGNFNPGFFRYPGFIIYASFFTSILHYCYLMSQNVCLESLSDITIILDHNNRWLISHPSFFLWSRGFVVLLGTGCVVVIYFILKENFGKIKSILGASLLAGLSFHICHSRYITPDMPMCFFILLCVLFALRFNHSHKLKDLILSTIFAGLAISSKYNAVIAIIIPLSACLLNLKSLKYSKTSSLGLTLILPFVVFLITNPFVIIDLEPFLRHSGWEAFHYKVLGHPDYISEPGIEHFIFQITQIRNNISNILFYLVFMGILVALRRPKSLFIVLIFPIIYTYCMVQQKVNFHRNFLCIYPFLAIFSSIAICFISEKFYKLGSFLKSKFFHKTKYLNISLSLVPFLILIPIIYNNHIQEVKKALYIWKTPETRTQAIHFLNSIIDTSATVGIAQELMLHPQDLKKLKAKYEIFEHKYIKEAIKRYDYLVVGEYLSRDKKLHPEDNRLNKLTPENYVYHIIHGDKMKRDHLFITQNPKIIILKSKKLL